MSVPCRVPVFNEVGEVYATRSGDHDWRLATMRLDKPQSDTRVFVWYCTRCRTIERTSDPSKETP